MFRPGDDVPDNIASTVTAPGAVENTATKKSSIDEGSEVPSKSWSVSRIREYAMSHGITLGQATKKNDLLSIIEIHNRNE